GLLSDNHELMPSVNGLGDPTQQAVGTTQQRPRLSERLSPELGHSTLGGGQDLGFDPRDLAGGFLDDPQSAVRPSSDRTREAFFRGYRVIAEVAARSHPPDVVGYKLTEPEVAFRTHGDFAGIAVFGD